MEHVTVHAVLGVEDPETQIATLRPVGAVDEVRALTVSDAERNEVDAFKQGSELLAKCTAKVILSAELDVIHSERPKFIGRADSSFNIPSCASRLRFLLRETKKTTLLPMLLSKAYRI